MRIRKIGVVGAGTMGAGIAALAASAGVPVVLLDIPGDDGDRGGPAKKGLERIAKSKPAAFMDPDRIRLIQTGNTEDDLQLLADCDWVVEAIIEQLDLLALVGVVGLDALAEALHEVGHGRDRETTERADLAGLGVAGGQVAREERGLGHGLKRRADAQLAMRAQQPRHVLRVAARRRTVHRAAAPPPLVVIP